MSTVAVTGASGQVGTLLRQRLAERGDEVRALNRGEEWAPAIAGADAVVHLAGTLQPRRSESYEEANLAPTATVAAAVREAGVGRVVFLSYVGADAASANAYLRAKAAAERLLEGSGAPTTIFRCLHVYGPPEAPGPTAGAFLAKRGRPVLVLGSGRQAIEPLYIGDVVAAILGALAPGAPSGTFELGGPERMSFDQLVVALNPPGTRLRHLPAALARPLAHLVPSLTPALVDLLLADNVAATPAAETAARFGFTPHRLAEVWPRQA